MGEKRQVEASRGDLREGKGYQGPTDHYEVENIPEVTEVGTLMQDEPQVDHLWGRREGAQNPHLIPTLGCCHPLSSLSGTGRKPMRPPHLAGMGSGQRTPGRSGELLPMRRPLFA